MREMFNPKKVAVVGVSPAPDNLARNILRNLYRFGFAGETFAVGPSGGEIYGKPIYLSPLDLPTDVDFAAILIPARFVPQTLDELGQRGVRRALISSGGFDEYSDDGASLGQQVLDVARRHGIRFMGPNCLGITNLENGLVLPFARPDPDAQFKGPNSIIAQSGGVKSLLMSAFSDAKMGYSKVISIGNKLDVDETDLLEFLAEDPATQTIFMYLEDIRRGRDFFQALRRCPKPVVVMKSNTSPESAEVAKSHTAALAGDDAVLNGALRQAGAVRVRQIDDFLMMAKAFSLPPCRGDNLVAISPSGGFAVISSDVARLHGFHLPPIPPEVVTELEERSRAKVIRFTNPIDFGDIYDRSATAYAVEAILKRPEVDAMAVTVPTASGGAMGFHGPEVERLLMDIRAAAARSAKPVAAAVFAAQDQMPGLIERSGFPIFPSIEEAIRALALQRDYWRNKEALGLP